jgi:hypothetical protein
VGTPYFLPIITMYQDEYHGDDGQAQAMAEAAWQDDQNAAAQHEMEAGYAAQAEAAIESMPSVDDLYRSVISLREAVTREGMERMTIETSPECLAIDHQINDLLERKQAMLATVPNSSSALEEAKRGLMDAMLSQGIDAYGNAKVSYREKNRVNVGRVLEVVGGDIGTFLEMTKVTQKTLADYAKLMPDLKKDLMACVELESREVTGLTISDPE